MKTQEQIIREIIKSDKDVKTVKGLKVKNVHTTTQDNYVMVSFTLDKPIAGFVEGEGGEYEKGETNILFSSTYAIAGMLKEDDELAYLANYIVEHPKSLEMLFSRATIDIIQQPVPAGTMYVNPFSTKEDGEGSLIEHDTVINHLISCELSKLGLKAADKIADLMLTESY